MHETKVELFETLANEINNSDWTLDSQTIVAAVDHKKGNMLVHLADGRSFTMSVVANRRKHVTRGKSKGANKRHP